MWRLRPVQLWQSKRRPAPAGDHVSGFFPKIQGYLFSELNGQSVELFLRVEWLQSVEPHKLSIPGRFSPEEEPGVWSL